MGRAVPASGARARAVALTAEHAAVLSLVAVSVLLTLLTWNRWGDLWLDTGYDLVAAAKVSHANAPYIDYNYWYGPLGALLLGAVFEMLGIGIGPAIALGLVMAFAAIGLTYAVARMVVGPVAAATAGLLVAVPALSNTNVSYVQPHTVAAPLGMLLCLAAILAVARLGRPAGRVPLVGLGAIAGLSALTRHECFGAIAFAVGVWLLLRVARATDRRRAVAELATVVGVSVGVAAAGYGAFLVAGTIHGGLSVGELIHDNLFPTALLSESVSTIIQHMAPGTPGSFAKLGAVFVAYAAGAGALVVLARSIDRGGRHRTVALAILAVVGVGLLLTLAVRPETMRFYLKPAFGWLPAGAVVASVLLVRSALRGRGGPWTTPAQVELLVGLMLVAFAYSAYAQYWPYPNPSFPQETAYAMPVVALFLVAVHARAIPRTGLAEARTLRLLGTAWIGLLGVICAGLLVHDARKESVMVHGVNGTIAANAVDGPVYQAAVDVIQSLTHRSEPILLAPQMTAIYVMTGRQDPLAQLSLLPGALRDDDAQRAAIQAMDDGGVRLAIVDRRPLTRYDHGAFGIEYDRLVGAWLHKSFSHIKTLSGPSAGTQEPRILDVWLRRTL
jgi:hypothetical protein